MDEKKGYLKRWSTPLNGCNAGTRFEERPVDNSPDFVPFDNSLFADLKNNHIRHCAITSNVPKTDERKFSEATQDMIMRGIKRLVEMDEVRSPTSIQIVQDCDRALDSMQKVYKAKGMMVPGLANRNRHRFNHNGLFWPGGKRVKNEFPGPTKWLDWRVLEIKRECQRGILDNFLDDSSSNDSDDNSV